MKKILFANKYSFRPDQFEKFEALDGLETLYLDGPDAQHYDQDFSDVNGIITFGFFNHNDIKEWKSLEYIHTTSTGIDQMPVDYLKEKGIILKNCPGVHSTPIAEFVVGEILQMYKKFFKLKKQQEQHIWQADWDLMELEGKRVCIISTGSIASHIAKRLHAFDAYIVGLDVAPRNDQGYYDEVLTLDHMDEELPKADIVINAVPLFPNTYHLFNQHCFDLMKDDAIFINITRGGVVDIDALQKTLEDGKLMGALVDVLEQEPLPADSPLWDIERLYITPHNSFAGEGNNDRVFNIIYNDTKEWLESAK
ncbi:MAG: NAD(P)-dependent oxidoreductase [Eubacteriales bacterium]|nr:NAD(P)-dependent oxidoreductase [Eubacteriales bacterium]